MTLADVPVRTPVTVASFSLAVDDQRRLIELGLRHGVEVEVLRRAPFGGPATVRVAGGLLALRKVQADGIVVTTGPTRG